MTTPNSITYGKDGHATSFNGHKAVDVFAMAVLESALRMYAKTGIRVNRAYTPKNMIAFASSHTGLKFKPRDYVGAADALRNAITEAKVQLLHIKQE